MSRFANLADIKRLVLGSVALAGRELLVDVADEDVDRWIPASRRYTRTEIAEQVSRNFGIPKSDLRVICDPDPGADAQFVFPQDKGLYKFALG